MSICEILIQDVASMSLGKIQYFYDSMSRSKVILSNFFWAWQTRHDKHSSPFEIWHVRNQRYLVGNG